MYFEKLISLFCTRHYFQYSLLVRRYASLSPHRREKKRIKNDSNSALMILRTSRALLLISSRNVRDFVRLTHSYSGEKKEEKKVRERERKSPPHIHGLIIITIITAVTVASALGGGGERQAIPARVITAG